jgi:hypothetical protein
MPSETLKKSTPDTLSALKKLLAAKGELAGVYYACGTHEEGGVVVRLQARDPKGATCLSLGQKIKAELDVDKNSRGTVQVTEGGLVFTVGQGNLNGNLLQKALRAGLGNPAVAKLLKKAKVGGAEEVAVVDDGEEEEVIPKLTETELSRLREEQELVTTQLQGFLEEASDELANARLAQEIEEELSRIAESREHYVRACELRQNMVQLCGEESEVGRRHMQALVRDFSASVISAGEVEKLRIVEELTARFEEMERVLSDLHDRCTETQKSLGTSPRKQIAVEALQTLKDSSIPISLKIEAALRESTASIVEQEGNILRMLDQLSEIAGRAEHTILDIEERLQLDVKWQGLVANLTVLRQRGHSAMETPAELLERLKGTETRAAAAIELEGLASRATEDRMRSDIVLAQEQQVPGLNLDAPMQGISDERKLVQMRTLQSNLREYLRILNSGELTPAERLQNLVKGTAHYILEKYAAFLQAAGQTLGPSREQLAAQQAQADWNTFTTRVQNGWTAFVNSGYDPRLRGINNFREYVPPESVRATLRLTGGFGSYVYSMSDSAGLSVKRTIPVQHRPRPHMVSYIFHLG